MDYSVFLKIFAGEKQGVFYPLGTFSQLFPSPLLGLLCFLFPWWQGQDNLLLGPAGSWATLELPFPKFLGSQVTGKCLLPMLQLLPTCNQCHLSWLSLSLLSCSPLLPPELGSSDPSLPWGSQACVGACCSQVSGSVGGQISLSLVCVPVSGPCWGCGEACAGPCPVTGCRKLVCAQPLFVLSLWPSVKRNVCKGCSSLLFSVSLLSRAALCKKAYFHLSVKKEMVFQVTVPHRLSMTSGNRYLCLPPLAPDCCQDGFYHSWVGVLGILG